MKLPELYSADTIQQIGLGHVGLVDRAALIYNPDTDEEMSLFTGSRLLLPGDPTTDAIGVMPVLNLGEDNPKPTYLVDLAFIEPKSIAANFDERGDGKISLMHYQDKNEYRVEVDCSLAEEDGIIFHQRVQSLIEFYKLRED